MLLEKNAPVKVKNEVGWSPLAEAISFGSRRVGMELTFVLIFEISCVYVDFTVPNEIFNNRQQVQVYYVQM